jgi:hypothetical protein
MSHIIAIMQPYFLPYIGYFQLIKAVDKFVIYDNIKYTKKGWINRNRFLQNGKDEYFTLSLKKDSDFLDLKERYISDNFDKTKLLNKIKSTYSRAPFYSVSFRVFEEILLNPEKNLFVFIYNSILTICKYLNINTEIILSSLISIDHNLKSVDKVLAICKFLSATQYVNPIGGVELYSKEQFEKDNIKLFFLETKPVIYKQFNNVFVPSLSILDIMMFNSKEEINKMLDKYELV